MRLSTRNQFKGKVTEITSGEAMSIVKIAIDGTDLVVTPTSRTAGSVVQTITGDGTTTTVSRAP